MGHNEHSILQLQSMTLKIYQTTIKIDFQFQRCSFKSILIGWQIKLENQI